MGGTIFGQQHCFEVKETNPMQVRHDMAWQLQPCCVISVRYNALQANQHRTARHQMARLSGCVAAARSGSLLINICCMHLHVYNSLVAVLLAVVGHADARGTCNERKPTTSPKDLKQNCAGQGSNRMQSNMDRFASKEDERHCRFDGKGADCTLNGIPEVGLLCADERRLTHLHAATACDRSDAAAAGLQARESHGLCSGERHCLVDTADMSEVERRALNSLRVRAGIVDVLNTDVQNL